MTRVVVHPGQLISVASAIACQHFLQVMQPVLLQAEDMDVASLMQKSLSVVIHLI